MTVLLLLVLLVLFPIAVALLFHPVPRKHAASTSPAFTIGTPVIYQRDEVSTCPTPDAHDVHPAEHGDYYYYSILNYLRVIDVLADGRIIAVARNQQRLCFWPNDSCVRKAHLRERFLHPLRFPRP